ncbi:MAG TPA: hypothetical protein VF384_06170 [Planctomycetota bacterium]
MGTPPRRLLMWTIVAVSATLIVTMAVPAVVRPSAQRVRLSKDRIELLDLLGDYQRAWQPDTKAQALDRIAGAIDHLGHAMHWLLSQPMQKSLPHAIEVAGLLRVEVVLQDLKALALHQHLRPAALIAVDRIEPLTDQELRDLFGETDKNVQLAALAIAKRHREPPVHAMMPLLRSRDAEVRNAVLKALPPQLPEECVPEVLAAAGDVDPQVAVTGLLALAHTPITREIEVFLAEQCTREALDVSGAALTALATVHGTLQPDTITRLWQVIERRASRQLVGRAFRCLEQTGSVDVAAVRRTLPDLDHHSRYFAARLLLRAGEADGVEPLFTILAAAAENSSSNPPDAEVLFATRGLLASLAGTSASASVAEWQDWFARNPVRRAAQLPAPQLNL